jgi:hypothetical protein
MSEPRETARQIAERLAELEKTCVNMADHEESDTQPTTTTRLILCNWFVRCSTGDDAPKMPKGESPMPSREIDDVLLQCSAKAPDSGARCLKMTGHEAHSASDGETWSPCPDLRAELAEAQLTEARRQVEEAFTAGFQWAINGVDAHGEYNGGDVDAGFTEWQRAQTEETR